MTKVRTKYLAAMREFTEKPGEEIELPENATITTYIEEILKRYPEAKKYLLSNDGKLRDGINVAVNGDVVPRSRYEQTLLRDGDEVVIIPPIAGG
ncbi:MAG: sulfur carrier protein ThiS [Aigarchaeota archaeon]|nr:sulfur carrier protein ThiS [Candidatus Geocrenenecus dongiae]